jgi:hypothetical protein
MKLQLGAMLITSCIGTYGTPQLVNTPLPPRAIIEPIGPAPPPAIGSTIGTTHVMQNTEILPLTTAEPVSPVPPVEAQNLLVATDELDTEHAVVDHAHVLSALYALVDSLELLVPDRTSDILRLRETTEEFSLSTDRDAELARIALDSATRALAHVQASADRDRARLAAAVVAMAGATDRLDPHRPLGEQSRELRSAFSASVRVVYAATGAPEPDIAVTPVAGR